jgi:hypothetical protein
MEKSMPLETVGDISYILVMQFDYFPDKNLKPENTQMMKNVTSKITKVGSTAKLYEGTHLFLQTNDVLLLWL